MENYGEEGEVQQLEEKYNTIKGSWRLSQGDTMLNVKKRRPWWPYGSLWFTWAIYQFTTNIYHLLQYTPQKVPLEVNGNECLVYRQLYAYLQLRTPGIICSSLSIWFQLFDPIPTICNKMNESLDTIVSAGMKEEENTI